MTFQLIVYPQDDEARRWAPLWVMIHGRLRGRADFALTCNGEDMSASWDGETLRFERSLTFELGMDTIKILNELDREDIPPAMAAALDALRSSGSEAEVETCGICGLIMPASLAKPFSVHACPKCVGDAHVTKYKKLCARPEDDPDPEECEPPDAPPEDEDDPPF